MSALIVFVTTSNKDEANKLTKTLVEEKLAACVSVVPSITSTYWWQGKVEKAKEALLIIKTESSRFEALTKRIKSLHSYAVPEVLALPVVRGNQDYLKWLKKSLKKSG